MNRKSGSIGNRMRRSSILKLDLNRDDETTGILFNKSRCQNRRVSFADTAQIKEFVRDSPRVWRCDSDSNEEGNDKENEPSKNKAGGVSITGLDSLLNGTIETQSYRNIVDCPIQELSTDSLNICDGNKTVLGQVDMETTLCVESEIGYSPFEPEPSMEIKFETASFLASMKSKAESMSPMQIYRSPKENTGRFGAFNLSSSDDTENIPPIMMDLMMDEPKMKPFDSKSFLSGLIGSKTMNIMHDDDQDELEETVCYGSVISNQVVTECKDSEFPVTSNGRLSVGGNKTVLGDDMGGIEETVCIGGILARTDEGKLKVNTTQMSGMNSTKYFGDNEQMDETLCQGLIMNSTQVEQGMTGGIGNAPQNMNVSSNVQSTVNGSSTILGNEMGDVDETTCLGGILSNVDKENIVPSGLKMQQYMESDRTRLFTEGMDETQCVGNILNYDFTTPARTGGILKDGQTVDNTRQLTVQSGAMDKTACTDKNEPSEVCEMETQGHNGQRDSNRTVYFTESDPAMSGGMETTACIGGILTDPHTSRLELSKTKDMDEDRNKTEYFSQNKTSSVMEETACEGRILQQSLGDTSHIREQFGEDKTKYFTENNYTAAIEETKCVGGIIKETTKTLKALNDNFDMNRSKYLNDGLEETKCIGGLILTSSKETISAMSQNTGNMDSHQDKVSQGITGSLYNVGNKPPGKESMEYQSSNKTIIGDLTMEETKSVGGILKDKISIHEGTRDGNRTVVGDLTMEETKSVGGILKDKISAHEGILDGNHTVVGDFTMEETKSVGGILKDKISIHERTRDWNHTVVEDMTMEETQSIGGILKNRISLLDENTSANDEFNKERTKDDTNIVDNVKSPSNIVNDNQIKNINEDNNPDLDKTGSKEMILDSNEKPVNANTDGQQVCPDFTDTEITFKTTNKRTLSEIQSTDTGNERTKDSTTSLKRIKEMLLLSAQKGASQNLRSGSNKTPSKPSTDNSASKSVVMQSPAMSPAHKRIRLFDTQTTELTENRDDLGVCPLAEVDGIPDKDSSLGIDEETMPVCMQTELLSSTMDIGDTHTDTGFYPNTTLRANDSRTTSSGNTSNLSMLSNRSMAKPFVVPDGPLSLDTFFKLTAKPLSCVKGNGRCSILPCPRIDQDSMEELLEAEIVVGPLVEAKKKLHDRITGRQSRKEENFVWLQKTLEETQPQVFQEVAKGDIEDIKAITDKLYGLFYCCSKDANTVWMQETKQMFEETMESVEVQGQQRIQGLLDDVRKQTDTAEQLLCSFDDDLAELDNLELQLEESEEKRNTYDRELTNAVQEVKKNEEIEASLKSRNEESQKGHMLQETRMALRHQIHQQLILGEWNLEEFEEDFVCFTFLEDEVTVRIDFDAGSKEKPIKNIDIHSCLKPGCRWLHKKVAHTLLLAAIDKDYLLNKYTHFSSLPKMLQELSTIVSEINSMCLDIKEVNKKNKLFWDNKTLSLELWNIKTLRMVKLHLKFSPELHLTTAKLPVNVLVEHLMGDVSVAEIEKCLLEVDTGSSFLPNLVQAVNLRLSNTAHHTNSDSFVGSGP